ncbi:methyltransferase [Bacillus altitudinis]|uniref:methyltransferase n=1 Tax=Bacillus altitudinis TaxID=293387 RepID=UPI0011A9F074|nr:methyltransferase [Bacillus altitudinis]
MKRNKERWELRLRKGRFSFRSESGVFCKKEVEYGWRVLIEGFEEGELDGEVLDVGWGYGRMGLWLGKEMRGGRIDMIDVKERGVEV